MKKTILIKIILIAIMQLLVAFNLFYVFYIKLSLKFNPFVNIVITFFAINLIIVAITLLKRNNQGRAFSMINLANLAFFSIIAIFFAEIHNPVTLSFCIIYFLASIYFIYYLNKSEVKKNFEREGGDRGRS